MSNARGMPGGGGMLKLRFDRYITVVQGLVSFNITLIQFGVLQLQQNPLETFSQDFLDRSFVQKLISKLFKLSRIIFIHTQLNFFFSLQKVSSIHEFAGNACFPKRHVPHSTEIQPSHPSEVEVGLCKTFKASFDDTLALGSRSQL